MDDITLKFNSYELLTLYHTLEKFYMLNKEIKITDNPIIKNNIKFLLTKIYMEAEKQCDMSVLMLDRIDDNGDK